MAVAFKHAVPAPAGAARTKERRGITAPVVKGKRVGEQGSVSVQLGGRWATLLQAEERCRATELEQHAELQVAAQALAAEQARSAEFREHLCVAQQEKSAAEDDNAELRCRVAQMAGQADGFVVCVALLQAELQAAERAAEERAAAYEDQQIVYTGVCSALIDADARHAQLAAENKSIQEALKASERTCSSLNKRVAEADLRARRALQAQREKETRLGIVIHEKERIAGLLQKKDKLARDLAHVAKRAMSESATDASHPAATPVPPPPPPPPPRHAAAAARVCTPRAAAKGRADAPDHTSARSSTWTHFGQRESPTPEGLVLRTDDARAPSGLESEAPGIAEWTEAAGDADTHSTPYNDARNRTDLEADATDDSSLSAHACDQTYAQTQVHMQNATHASTRSCTETITASDTDASGEAGLDADTLGDSATALIARHSPPPPPFQPATQHCVSTGRAQHLLRTHRASGTSGTSGTSGSSGTLGTSGSAWLRGVPVPDQLRAENAVLHGVIRDRDRAMAQMQEQMHKLQREHAAMLIRWRGCMQKGRSAS